MSDILDRIITVKRDEIRVAQESVSLEELRLQASTRDSRDFVGALRAKHAAGKFSNTSAKSTANAASLRSSPLEN